MRWRAALGGTAALCLTVAVAFWARHDDHRLGPGTVESSGAQVNVALPPARADPTRGAGLFGRCAACHSIGHGAVDRDGPNLFGVVGSPIAGRRPRFAYTAALRRLGGVWSVDRLDAWLTDPKALVPGTAMAFPGIPDARDRADLIAYLASQGPGVARR